MCKLNMHKSIYIFLYEQAYASSQLTLLIKIHIKSLKNKELASLFKKNHRK